MKPTNSSDLTFLFADLAGFAALTEAHGDVTAAEIAADFERRVRELLPRGEAQAIKTIGDEVMVLVDDPLLAVRLGLRIVEVLSAPGAPPVRVGMHSGPAVERDGDWFGRTVNLASRVADSARAGEVILTDETRHDCGDPGALEFEERGLRQFRHIPEPVAVYAAISPTGAGRSLEIDPVCRMAVDPDRAAATRHRRGQEYYFCSARCERSFDAEPRRYIATSAAARAARTGFYINLCAFLVVGAIHVVGWLTGLSHDESTPPMFVYVGVVWALGLVLHYRAVRRVL